MVIRNILFDLGGTLWHTPVDDAVPARATQAATAQVAQLFESWGVPGTSVASLVSHLMAAIESADREAYAASLVSPDFGGLARAHLKHACGIDASAAQANALLEALSVDGKTLGRRLMPQVHETLDWLRARGCRLGCASNRFFAGSRLRKDLQEMGLDRYFECVAASCDVGYLKPHPRIFEHVLRQMRIDPSETAMVGDSLRADVGGARAAGMTAIWCRNGRAEDPVSPASPDHSIDSLADLRGLRQVLFRGD